MPGDVLAWLTVLAVICLLVFACSLCLAALAYMGKL